jgi:hypothetical protein
MATSSHNQLRISTLKLWCKLGYRFSGFASTSPFTDPAALPAPDTGPVDQVGLVGAGLSSNVRCRILSRNLGREERVAFSHRHPTREDSQPLRLSLGVKGVDFQVEARDEAIGFLENRGGKWFNKVGPRFIICNQSVEKS